MADRATDYIRLIEECIRVAGVGDCYWNKRFSSALLRRGLMLATVRPPHDSDDFYPYGSPVFAPNPYGTDGCDAWPESSLIVWSAAQPTREGD